MVTKTIRVSDEDWKIIEKELNESGLSFADFARNRLMQKNQNENQKSDLKDFSEILKNNCKTLDIQIAKYISVLLEKIEAQQNKIDKILENRVYADFEVIANYEDEEKINNINFYQVGDFLRSKKGILNVILKINREKEEILIASYPITEEDLRKETKWVHVKKDVAPKLYEMYRIKKD